MTLTSVVVGATSAEGSTFTSQVNNGTGNVRVAVADNPTVSGPVFTSAVAKGADNVTKNSIAGLDTSTRYWYQVEDNGSIDTALTGTFLTHPTIGEPYSFTVGVGSCAGATASVPGSGAELAPSRVSNHPVFRRILAKALEENWLGNYHIGDISYYDPGSGIWVPDASVATYRRLYSDVLLQSNQLALMSQVSFQHGWDDHEFGPNNADGTFAFKANADQVWRERMSHYTPLLSTGCAEVWQIARVLFVKFDTRYFRSPNSDPDGPAKVMIGATQLAAVADVLAANPNQAKALVCLMPTPWATPTGADTWAGYRNEQALLTEVFRDTGWLPKMVMVYGDRHAAGIDTGANNEYGSFPIMQASSYDSTPATVDPNVVYNILADTPGRGQYGTLQITDTGNVITIKMSMWQMDTLLGSYQLGISTGESQPIGSGALLRTLSGSHRAVVEARVVTGFPTGDDPEGVDLPILEGDVSYDATADVYSTMSMGTLGIDLNDYKTRFPRHRDDLLNPFGTEVFLRRGVDLGNEVLWSNLGYYRISAVEQADSHDGPILLTGPDRMQTIIDSDLLEPREFTADRPFLDVITDLVQEIYPEAVIVFDDASGQQSIGRQLIAEQSRYAFLADLVKSLGKVMFWDGQGVLRIEDAPDPDDLAWEVKAGYGGVLVNSPRRVTREGVYNAVVATGEGATESPVRGVAVDNGPNSPTRFGGPFGRIPYMYSSPLLTTNEQAILAAQSILRRNIGTPFSVDFGAVVNPSLRPRQAVRITQKDGSREKHIIQTCMIPLSPDAAMMATTKEKSLYAVGVLR